MSRAKLPPLEIDAKEYEKFKILTEREGKSISKVVRELIAEYNERNTKKPSNIKKYLEQFVIEDNKPESKNMSTNYKKYIYGDS